MFSSDKNVETIGQLVEVLKHYIGLQSEYMKLDVVDKVLILVLFILFRHQWIEKPLVKFLASLLMQK